MNNIKVLRGDEEQVTGRQDVSLRCLSTQTSKNIFMHKKIIA
jgi:hypothetical protein